MSEKKTVYCDFCGLEINSGLRSGLGITFRFIQEPDPSGNGYITQALKADFCENCLSDIVVEAYKSRKTNLTFAEIFSKSRV